MYTTIKARVVKEDPGHYDAPGLKLEPTGCAFKFGEISAKVTFFKYQPSGRFGKTK